MQGGLLAEINIIRRFFVLFESGGILNFLCPVWFALWLVRRRIRIILVVTFFIFVGDFMPNRFPKVRFRTGL